MPLRSQVFLLTCDEPLFHPRTVAGGNIFTWGWGGSYGTFSEEAHSSGGQLV